MKLETQGTYVKIENEKGIRRYIELATDSSNCKLSYIHQAGSLADFNEAELKEVFDHVLNSLKGCVILNTIQKKVFDFIKTTYPVYYAQEVPIGYNGGYQYHVCFQNIIRKNLNCRAPEVKASDLNKATIEAKLIDVLKKKRRKTDYVIGFINSL